MTREMYWDLNTSFYISAGPYVDGESVSVCMCVGRRGYVEANERQTLANTFCETDF